MDKFEAIRVLTTEAMCVERGKDCDRECENCDLLLDAGDILEAYGIAIKAILEASPLPKYYLSAKACEGILNRASKRGKELPPELKEALVNQIAALSKSEGGR